MDVNYVLNPSETAFDLYERINSAHSISTGSGTEPIFHFFQVPSITFLKGLHGSGKTEFLYQLILSTILPQFWGPVEIGGLGQVAIYFDLDLKFSIVRFLDLTRHKFLKSFESYVTRYGQPQLEMEDISQVIFRCFKRIHIFRCSDQLQLTTTIRMIAKNNTYDETKLVALDSLDCFYYPEIQSNYFRKSIDLSEVALSYLKNLRAYKSMNIVASVSMLYKPSIDHQIITLQKNVLTRTCGSDHASTSYQMNISESGLSLS